MCRDWAYCLGSESYEPCLVGAHVSNVGPLRRRGSALENGAGSMRIANIALPVADEIEQVV